jgi:hypothetical protein
LFPDTQPDNIKAESIKAGVNENNLNIPCIM